MRFGNIPLRMAASLVLGALSAYASGTTAWEMNSYADFIKGRFDGISLSRDGRLALGPKLDTVFAGDQPVIWSVAEGPDGSLYAATGNRGRVYRIDKTGKSSLYWTANEPEVFAIAADKTGAIYAGTSPDGKVYRIVNGQASEYFAPKTRYIWSLALAPDGVLFVGTGDHGQIFRVTAAGKGEVYYETGQSHITGLAVDSAGRLLAGSEPNGILYRVTAKDKAFVLYDAPLPEIRAIVPMPDGTIYVAALGGSVARQTQAAAQATQNNPNNVVQGGTYSITVNAQGGNVSEIKPDTKLPQPVVGATPQVTSTITPTADMSNVDKSAIYRVNADNTVETLWNSKDENVYDILSLEKQLLFSTDLNGRIYGLSPDRRVTLLAQTNEGEAMRLLASDHSIIAATGNMGRILRMGEGPGVKGSFESPVHDSTAASKWGSLSWRATLPAGSTLAFRTRSGNSAKPDRTWSDWSEPLTDAQASSIASPNARYIQWKLEMTGGPAAVPILNAVTLSYLPRNSPPVVHSVNVVMLAVASTPATRATSTTSSGASTDTDSSSSASVNTTQTLPRAFTQQITVAWAAEDPDGDRLVYAVYFRGDEETQWKPLKTATHETTLTFDADVLADGKYTFRVIASDREANPAASARETILDSAPVVVDNTPPTVVMGAHSYANGSAHVEWEAVDAASPLRHCEYSLDAGDWVPAEAADGVIDSLREKFSLDLNNLKPGEHLLTVRVGDSANNTGVAKIVLK